MYNLKLILRYIKVPEMRFFDLQRSFPPPHIYFPPLSFPNHPSFSSQQFHSGNTQIKGGRVLGADKYYSL